MYKIFIIEDDDKIAEGLKDYLSKWDYEVAAVKDFKMVREEFLAFEPELVLLDITLPYFNGFHWCNEIRKVSKVPIIFLSSASDNMNIVMAINMGGDDFIAKPFDLMVLTAKIQALLRRSYSFRGEVNMLEHQGVRLNISDATVSFLEEKVELTKNEFRILQMLMECSGKVVKRDQIKERLWESDSYVDDNTLTVNVNRLRKKLETIGVFQYIETKKGIGYFIRENTEKLNDRKDSR